MLSKAIYLASPTIGGLMSVLYRLGGSRVQTGCWRTCPGIHSGQSYNAFPHNRDISKKTYQDIRPFAQANCTDCARPERSKLMILLSEPCKHNPAC